MLRQDGVGLSSHSQFFCLCPEYGVYFFNAALLGSYEKELRKLFGALEMSLSAGSNSKFRKQM